MSELVDADGFQLRDAAAGGDAAVVLAHPDAVDAEDGARRPARVRLAALGHEAALLRRRLQHEAAPARRHGRGGERHQQQRGEERERIPGARHGWGRSGLHARG